MRPTLLLIFLLLIYSSCEKEHNFNAEQKNIVVLGSSTAVGLGASQLDSSWVGRLAHHSTIRDQKVKIINLAKSGYTSCQIRSLKDSLVGGMPLPDSERNIDKALSLKPALVIISLPSNDFNYPINDNTIGNNFQDIIKVLQENNVNYILLSTQPRYFSKYSTRLSLKNINIRLKKMSNSSFVMIYDFLANKDLLIDKNFDSGDGVHLNDLGHYVIYNSITNSTPFKTLVSHPN